MTLTVVFTGPKTKDRNTSKPLYDMEPLCGKALFSSVAIVQDIASAATRVGVISYSHVIDQYGSQRSRIGHLDLVKRSLVVPDKNDLIR